VDLQLKTDLDDIERSDDKTGHKASNGSGHDDLGACAFIFERLDGHAP